MIPDSTFWWRLALMIGAETTCIVMIAWAATRYVKSATASRLIWRTAIVCLLLVTLSGLTGVGQKAAHQLAALRPESRPQPSVVLEKEVYEGVVTGPVITSRISLPEVSPAKINFWPGVVWLFGFAAVVTRIMLASGLLVYLRISRKRPRDATASEQLIKVVARLGIRRRVELIESPGVTAPFTFGVLRPVIVVPAQFVDRFSAEQRDVVLTHELAHVAAWDSLWHFLADATSAVLWWNPFVWLARRQLHDAAEIAADEVVATIDNGAETLADCLVAMARHATNRWRWSRLGINGNGSALKRRVERLLALGAVGSLATTWRTRAIQLCGAVSAMPVAFLVCGWAQDKNPVNDRKFGEPLAPLSVISRAVAGKEPKAPDFMSEMLKDAKAMYEMGDLAEATRELRFVLMMNPTNKAALYYMDLIRESNHRDRSDQRQQNLLNWNQPLLLPSFPPKQFEPGHKPLPLSVQDAPIAQRRTDKVLPPEELAAYTAILGAGGVVRLAKSSSSSDTASVPKKQQQTNAVEKIYSKQFHVNVEFVSNNLKRAGKEGSNISDGVKQMLEESGVDFSDTRKTLSISTTRGMLLARMTLSDLETIDKVLGVLNGPPPQMTIEAKFAELTTADLKRFGIADTTVQTLDTDRDYRQLMRVLSEAKVRFCEPLRVTTLSGRQAHMAVRDEAAPQEDFAVGVTGDISADKFSIHLFTILRDGKLKNLPKNFNSAGEARVSDQGTMITIAKALNGSDKRLVAFVTASVIDPAGNLIHKEEEIINAIHRK